MTYRRVMGWGTAALLVTTLLAFLPSSRLAGQAYEKICPITFRLYPGTKLETSCAARVEKDNAKLSAFLSDLRMNGDLKQYREEVRVNLANAKLTAEAKQKALRKMAAEVESWIKKRSNPFLGTYLEDPRLTTETGTQVEGLEAVVAELARIVASSTYVDAQSVWVELEYLPYGSPEYDNAQKAYPAKKGEMPVDMIAHIKTVLAYAPDDAPPVIEGKLPHRYVCFD